MHDPRISLLALLLAAALTAGCETVVEVSPPHHTSQLVAQSFFSPDSVWAVRVTSTVPYASPEAPAYVDDASIEVWEGNRLVATPTLADSGTYVASGSGPVLGRTYTLRVSAPGYAPTEGSDALPLPPPVTAFRDTLVRPADSLSRRRITRVEITLEDPPGQDNHYGLLVVQARWSEHRRTGERKLLPPTLFTFESDDPALGESVFDFLNTEKTLYREAFFTDGLFDGSTYTLDFDVQYDAPRAGADVVIRRLLAVVMLSVSEDFYRYWETASRQAFTNENPFAEPLRVHANMTAGFGVFAGFQYRIHPLGAGDISVGGYTLGDLCRLVGGQLPICASRRFLGPDLAPSESTGRNG